MAGDEAEAAAADAEGGGSPKPKRMPGKILVLLVGGPVLLLIVLVAAFFLFSGGDKPKETADAHGEDHGEDHGEGHGKDEKAKDLDGEGHGDHGDHDSHGEGHAAIKPLKPEDAIFFELPDILVNLNATGTRQTYLKLKVALELHKDADTTTLDGLLPRVIDKFQVYLREMRVEDLSGSAGLFRLKEELLRRVNAASHPVHVYNILFKEMLIQ
ncbi:MAG: flagellar basal body-associated FliL family protein [Alphaproteobacteria bacterium]